MTTKIYTTAKGKPVDLGALRLQNENVRAVGNMGVNSRGDRIDAQGNVIDSVNQQLDRKIQRQTNVSSGPVQVGTPLAQEPYEALVADEMFEEADGPMDALLVEEAVVAADPVQVVEAATVTTDITDAPAGGLAAAIARAKTVKQELEKTARQKAQDQGVRKI